MTRVRRRKKLIEVSIPLEAINRASSREKSIRHGHPSTLHLWWARRPLAACRAVLFAQLVDDPSSWPDRFRTNKEQQHQRRRLHRIIEKLVPWEASVDENILDEARWEIARSIAWGKGEEPPQKNSPDAVLNYLQKEAPIIHDPFCGGGSIPIEAQRLGLRAHGSDLNPVAVLISKALVEIPPNFNGWPPVNPNCDPLRIWKGAEGLADDICYYGQWMRDEAEKHIANLYPKIRILPTGVSGRSDLKPYVGKKLTVIAWLWARTVASPDPMAKGVHVPLVSSFLLSTKPGRLAWVEIIHDDSTENGWRFEVRTGDLSIRSQTQLKKGTKTGRGANFVCALTGTPINAAYIKREGKAGCMGTRLMAIVAEGKRARVYISPNREHWQAANICRVSPPEIEQAIPEGLTGVVWCDSYGLDRYDKLFSARQMSALATFSNLVTDVHQKILADAKFSNLSTENQSLAEGGRGIVAYADAVTTYLAFAVDRAVDYWSTLCTWVAPAQIVGHTFVRQVLPMVWDYAECNPFSTSTGNWTGCVNWISKSCARATSYGYGKIDQVDASRNLYPCQPVVLATDPPYFNNIGYADLSDVFYVWLRRSMAALWPSLFRRVLTPKNAEIVAASYRHGGRGGAEQFFMKSMNSTLGAMHAAASDGFPVTIYYAFKQSEIADEGLTSPGWATFLQAVVDSGFVIDGTWPVRTERGSRLASLSANALASSIILVCIKRPPEAINVSRREFVARLKRELPTALQNIWEAGVGPVDIAQSALGPGIGIFSSYAEVLESNDSKMTVRQAIALVNEVREEILGEQDAGYDPETRFCIDWFQAFGMDEGRAGDAINMSNAYNLSLERLQRAQIFRARGGAARILLRSELRDDWRPSGEKLLTHWQCMQGLVRALESKSGGTEVAGELAREMGAVHATTARSLAYRLYDICEKNGWAQEARSYSLLAEEFPEIEREFTRRHEEDGWRQGTLFDQEEASS